MIPVKPASEPSDFDRTVRQPGLRAIAELVGEAPQRRAGKPFDQVAESKNMIPAASFSPYWREALDDLQAAYDAGMRLPLCSHLDRSKRRSLRREVPALGSGIRVEQLSVGVRGDELNSYKGEYGDGLDPFELQYGWFALELVEFQVVPRAGLADSDVDLVQATIRRLHLNVPRFCRIRAEYCLPVADLDAFR